MSQAIKPGERITVDAVARELGLSQSPVREAMALLETDGLVVKIHLVGYRATPQLTRTQFENLFEFRLLIEPHAASRAAANMTEAQAHELAAFNERMAGDAGRAERLAYSAFADLDARLHDSIAAASGNELLRDQLARLHSHVHLFRLHHDSTAPVDAIGEHAVLIDAVTAGDRRGAQRAMRVHLERSRSRFRKAFVDVSDPIDS